MVGALKPCKGRYKHLPGHSLRGRHKAFQRYIFQALCPERPSFSALGAMGRKRELGQEDREQRATRHAQRRAQRLSRAKVDRDEAAISEAAAAAAAGAGAGLSSAKAAAAAGAGAQPKWGQHQGAGGDLQEAEMLAAAQVVVAAGLGLPSGAIVSPPPPKSPSTPPRCELRSKAPQPGHSLRGRCEAFQRYIAEFFGCFEHLGA